MTEVANHVQRGQGIGMGCAITLTALGLAGAVGVVSVEKEAAKLDPALLKKHCDLMKRLAERDKQLHDTIKGLAADIASPWGGAGEPFDFASGEALRGKQHAALQKALVEAAVSMSRRQPRDARYGEAYLQENKAFAAWFLQAAVADYVEVNSVALGQLARALHPSYSGGEVSQKKGDSVVPIEPAQAESLRLAIAQMRKAAQAYNACKDAPFDPAVIVRFDQGMRSVWNARSLNLPQFPMAPGVSQIPAVTAAAACATGR